MSDLVRVGLVGIAGYGEHYLRALLDEPGDTDFKLVGVADPYPQRSSRVDQLLRMGTRMHHSMDELLDHCNVDLLIMATPPHMHAAHLRQAMSRGLSVLCEKPLAATFDQARQLAHAGAAAARAFPDSFIAVGFQWCFSAAIQALKQDVMDGEFGAPIRLRAIALYPRPASYYSRNHWAGKQYLGNGDPVFDSPVNNATSHFLHAMLYILGEQRASSAIPVQLTAELYRANPIETFDAAAIRAFTHGGVELLFYTAHCVAEQFGPSCVYEFERARIDYSFSDGTIVAHFKDGRIKAYGSPSVRPMQKLWSCIDAVRTGEPIACGIAAALPHTLCASAAYGPDTAVHPISGPWIRQCGSEDNPLQCVEGLADGFLDCFERGVMPSEAASSHMPWAQAGESTDLQTDRWSLEASDELPIDALRHHLNLQDDVTGDGSLEAALV